MSQMMVLLCCLLTVVVVPAQAYGPMLQQQHSKSAESELKVPQLSGMTCEELNKGVGVETWFQGMPVKEQMIMNAVMINDGQGNYATWTTKSAPLAGADYYEYGTMSSSQTSFTLNEHCNGDIKFHYSYDDGKTWAGANGTVLYNSWDGSTIHGAPILSIAPSSHFTRTTLKGMACRSLLAHTLDGFSKIGVQLSGNYDPEQVCA